MSAKLDKQRTIHADPSKAFFIDMLTRDIGVTDCILDLVDNAIDKAVEQTGLDVMSILVDGKPNVRLKSARISISYSSSDFKIEDTCGGISIAEARDQVFLFGNPGERGAEGGLSVYGIGMKRAFFKLGRHIELTSATNREAFGVVIDVDKWKRLKKWEFEFDHQEQGAVRAASARRTLIYVTKLREGAAERLSQKSFAEELRERLATTYALFLQAGLQMLVNGKKVGPLLPSLATRTLTPARKTVTFKDVRVLIIAGVTPREDSEPRGWYVFCNGRMVLGADRTKLSGWGDNFPIWHSKYNHFLGFVYFQAADVRQLPWRTTKQGVEREAAVYQAALAEMRVQARPILNLLNDLYTDSEETESAREVLENATSTPVDKLSRQEASFKVKTSSKRKPNMTRIQYSRPRKLLERIAAHLGDARMSGTKIGEYTFDYFVEQELG